MTILHAIMICYYGTLEAFVIVSLISLIMFHARVRLTLYARVTLNSLFVSALEAVRPPIEMHAIAG